MDQAPERKMKQTPYPPPLLLTPVGNMPKITVKLTKYVFFKEQPVCLICLVGANKPPSHTTPNSKFVVFIFSFCVMLMAVKIDYDFAAYFVILPLKLAN